MGDEEAGPVDCKQDPSEAFLRPGWAILTGTKEAVGNHAHPDNVKANDELRVMLPDFQKSQGH